MKILETQYGEDFVGREYDIEEGKKKIRENGVVVLTGNRGIGKTNLMRVLEDFFKNERECHYIESGSLFSMEMSRYFLPEKVPTGVSHSASAMGFGGGAGRSWSSREETLIEGMEKSSEMSIFIENAHDLKKEDIQIIFAGTGRNNKLKFVLEIAKPYYPDADLRINPEQLVELGKLVEEDIGKIVVKECPDFTEDVVKRIVFLSNGYPYIARSLAYICEKKESEADMLVFLNTLKDKDMEHNLNNIHNGVLATLDKEAQALIKKLAIAPPVLTLPLIEAFCGGDTDTSLAEVIEKGVLKDLENAYVIYHPLFRDYLQKIQRISLKNKRKIYLEAMEEMKSEPDSFYLLIEVMDEIDIFKELMKIVENFDVINLIGSLCHTWGKLEVSILSWSSLQKKAIESEDKTCELLALCNMGNVYQTQGDMLKALEYYEQSLKIVDEIENKEGLAILLGNTGLIYQKNGNLSKALEYYEKSLRIHEEVGNKKGFADVYGNIGMIYDLNDDMSKALEYYEKTLKLHEEIGNKEGIANSYGNMGVVYDTLGDMNKSLEYHTKSLEIHKEIGNKLGVGKDYVNIGVIYFIQSEFSKSLNYYEKSLELFKKVGSKQEEAEALINIGIVFVQKGNIDKALDYYLKAQDISIDYAPHLFEEISEKVNRLLAMQ